MHHAMKDLPVVEDYGDGFCSRLVEWGGMIVSYETFPKGVDATPLFKGPPEILEFSPRKEYQRTIDVVANNMAAATHGRDR